MKKKIVIDRFENLSKLFFLCVEVEEEVIVLI